MDFIDNLIKTSLLGTERQSIEKSFLPEAVVPLVEKIEEKNSDKEAQFLQTAALLINYHHAGRSVEKVEFVIPQPAAAEQLPYCSEKAIRSLQSVFDEGVGELLKYWLEKAVSNKQILNPSSLPVMLDEGRRNIKIRHLIKEVVGNRGLWIAQFNEEWQYILSTEKEIWETGKPEERKQLLIQLRPNNPQKARELLTASWKEENANLRADLLNVMAVNLSKEDEVFFSEVLKDKSSKVTAIATDLVSRIDQSDWIRQLWEFGKSWFSLKTSKTLLLGTNEEVVAEMPTSFPPELKLRGFQEVSSNKELKDQEYWLLQFISLIPPAFFEQYFKKDPEKIIALFLKDPLLQKVVQGFIHSTIRHQDKNWAKVLLEEKLNRNEFIKILTMEELYALLDLLAPEDKKYFYDKNLEKRDFPFKRTLIDFLYGLEFQWDLAFTIKAMKDIATESLDGYFYGNPKLVALAHYADTSILDHLAEIEPKEEHLKDRWKSMFGRFLKVLEVRREIDESF